MQVSNSKKFIFFCTLLGFDLGFYFAGWIGGLGALAVGYAIGELIATMDDDSTY